MNKQLMRKIFLVLLPVLAVGLATTEDSVVVYGPEVGTMYGSYFDLLPAGSFPIITPLAAILGLTSGILAAIYAAFEKEWSLKGCMWTAFFGSVAAVVPILIREETLIVPNVFYPILLVAEAILAYVMIKKPIKKTEVATGRRLERH